MTNLEHLTNYLKWFQLHLQRSRVQHEEMETDLDNVETKLEVCWDYIDLLKKESTTNGKEKSTHDKPGTPDEPPQMGSISPTTKPSPT